MRSIFHGKVWIILLALMALAGLIVLASGLSTMHFDQPIKGSGFENLFKLSDLPKSGEELTAENWLRYLIPAAVIIIFLLFLGPIKPQSGSDLIKQIMRFTVFAFVAMLFMGRFAQNNPLLNEAENLPVAGGSQTGLENFTAPTPTKSIEFWITALIVIIVGAVVIFFVNRFVDRFVQPRNALDEIARIAHSTIQELSAETVSDNAIIQCYVRMNDAVNEWKGITRKEDRTPAEFARELVDAGLPADAVHVLTRIFEKVRYGGHGTGPNEIQEAINCLTDILKACQSQL